MKKSMVYRWAQPWPRGSSEARSISLDWANYSDFSMWNFSAVTPVEEWPKDARMSCNEFFGDRAPDDVVPNHLGLMVVSRKFRDVLFGVEGSECCVQCLPVALDYHGENLGEYFILNVLTSIRAMDKERSRYSVYTSLDPNPVPVGTVKFINRLVLLPGLLKPTVPAFRLQESDDWVLFSPSLRAALASAGITGMGWKEAFLSSDFD